MLRTILVILTSILLGGNILAQHKIGDNSLVIDSASILELESTDRGFLISRLTSTQRNGQSAWKAGHLIYNTTDSCLQIFNGISWECLVQGILIDSTVYKYDGILTSDRTINLGGNRLTFDGSSDVVITSDGRLGIGTATPQALFDLEGGTMRLSDYGVGTFTGTPSFLLGVDGDGDVIEIDIENVGTDNQTIDTLLFDGANLRISLERDNVPASIVDISSVNTDNQAIDTFYVSGTDLVLSIERDSVAAHVVDLSSLDLNIYNSNGTLTGTRTVSMGGNNLTFQGTSDVTITETGNVGIGTSSPSERLHVSGGTVRLSEYGIGTQVDTSARFLLASDTLGNVVELNTAKNTRWFYPPAITIDASALVTGETIDVYQEYVNQFTNIPINQRSPGAPASLPVYNRGELHYMLVYYDSAVMNNVTIDANGVLTYDIINVPFDNYVIVNVVFYIR